MRPILPCCLVWLTLFAGNVEASRVTRSLGIVAPDGRSTVAYDANAAGQVVAVLEDDEGRQRGVLYEKGVLTELAKPGGMYSDARAINPGGQVVGSARNSNGSWTAFRFERGQDLLELGTLGGPSSYGMAINDAGHVAGFADLPSGDWHAFLYDGRGAMRDLGTLGGKISYAAGMNNVGQVVGTAAQHDEYRRAFLYDPVRGMINLGTLGGRISSATAVNDAGLVVGASETKNRKWHAFIYDGHKMIDLGAAIGYGASFATDINNAGHVVGTVLHGDERRSWVWRNGKMTVHRGGKGLHLTNAINDRNLVIGATMGRTMDAATMAASAVPAQEPRGRHKFVLVAAVAFLGAIVAVIYRRRYRGISLPSIG